VVNASEASNRFHQVFGVHTACPLFAGERASAFLGNVALLKAMRGRIALQKRCARKTDFRAVVCAVLSALRDHSPITDHRVYQGESANRQNLTVA
jgi:hypothetical protein